MRFSGFVIIFIVVVVIANIISTNKKRMTARRIDTGVFVEVDIDSTYQLGDTVLLPINASTQFKHVIVSRQF